MIKIFIPVSSKDEEQKSFCMDDYIMSKAEDYPIIIRDEYLPTDEIYILSDLAYRRMKYDKYSY